MLWEVEIQPLSSEVDREAERVLHEIRSRALNSISTVRTARSYLVEGMLAEGQIQFAERMFADPVVESYDIRELPAATGEQGDLLLNVLFKPGVTDNVGATALRALQETGMPVTGVATCRKYWINADADPQEVERLATRVLANESIEHVLSGPLQLNSLSLGREYRFELHHVPLRGMTDEQLAAYSKTGQLYLSLVEMQTIQQYFVDLERDPTDIELETIAQTWSEHCSHKTLAGRIAYRDENGERHFENMLKETVFAATQQIRQSLGESDWCVSVFKDNAGIVRFDEKQDVCIKVETHNHPSALEPYGGANTGLGGVIRDPLGTGLGARPVCNTDVFCFAPPDTPYEALPPGVLHPRTVMNGVVSGVRDYGNRMGIPTVNGAVFFDPRYLGNPLVYCGNVAMIPRGMSEKQVLPGDLIVALGGRTGRDGIHGATFSSAELTHESEELSGGAVQIGNPIVEKMVHDVLLQARDRKLFRAVTDCGAGGFSSAVGEMGEETGAEVWLERAPVKYEGLTYTEIWISEAQERMVFAVPPENWSEFETLCRSEGVEATVIGEFTDTQRLVLKYQDQEVGNLAMSLLHDGRPPVVRDAVYQPVPTVAAEWPAAFDFGETLQRILGSLNVCSKEWIIRQYDHEVQGGSVVKPLVGVQNDGPSDAAVIRPDLTSSRGLVIACGMNPRLGDFDPYWMAATAIDEAIRNCIAVGADPSRIAILDNFCWGNTERPETLGSLVRAALGCHDFAIAFGTPFVSGKDSLNNEFRYEEEGQANTARHESLGASDGQANTARHESSGASDGQAKTQQTTITIPSSLLITALGQVEDVEECVTMDLKAAGNVLLLVGETKDEFAGSHFQLVHNLRGGQLPQVDAEQAPKIFRAVHAAIQAGLVRSCHDLSEGGLAVAAAEMAFAGEIGIELDLTSDTTADLTRELFAESNSRFLLEVAADRVFEVLSCFETYDALTPVQIGRTTDADTMLVRNAAGEAILTEDLTTLKSAWQRPLSQF